MPQQNAKPTVAVAILREIRGNSRYWLELLEKQGPGATAKSLATFYAQMPEEELVTWLTTSFEESGTALVELGESIETTPIPFRLRTDEDEDAPRAS